MCNNWRVTAKRPRELLVPWERTKALHFILDREMLLFFFNVLLILRLVYNNYKKS